MSEIEEPEELDSSPIPVYEIEESEEAKASHDPEFEVEESELPKPSQIPVKPLPRLWKSETDEPEDDGVPGGAADRAAKSSSNQDHATAPSRSSSGTSKKAKVKELGPNGEKKVLVEETPVLDTYESRRRARLLVGGLSTTCAVMLCWIGYRTFVYDPSPVDMSLNDPTVAQQGGPEPKVSKDGEARFMFNRAKELASNGRPELAIAMLNKVATVYKDTQTAGDAKAALDRSGKNMPLFSPGPIVLAEAAKPAPPPPSAPPKAVVQAKPTEVQATRGQAALVLPANPPETVVVPPSARTTLAPTRSTTTTAARALPPGFQAGPDAGMHESGWPLLIIGDRDGAPMVLVPGGTFTMGNDDGLAAERPSHQVRLSTYYIDQHEVTNHQFRIFLAEKHYKGQPPGKWRTDEKALAEPETRPVVFVNFHDAHAYAGWAGKQLPTEAQWEMAARSTDGRRFPWGDEPPKWSRTVRQIDNVLAFPEDVSVYGAFDMAGNVQEWTKDWWDSKYFQQVSKNLVDNPTGPANHPRSKELPVVVKGGSKSWVLSYREGVPYEKRLAHVGFRCVLSVESPGASPSGQPQGIPANAAGRANAPAPPF